MKRKTIPLLLTAALSLSGLAEAKKDQPEKNQPRVQIALLLDTSNSMDGLIDQAKTQLWSIVNTFGHAEKDGKNPFVEVALYEYGNDSLSSEKYWIRQVQPLTRDLDEISERLFGLRTNGGSEYCGAVIKQAMQDLDWHPGDATYRAIFIAGNEPFNQGPIDPAVATKLANEGGVIVNTIHCGAEAVGANTGWKTAALATGGEYAFIDQNKKVVHIEAPQDKIIIELNSKLNGTYIRFGSKGAEGLQKQQAQDANADAGGGGAFFGRAVTKATANYHNANWDLVDAAKQKEFKLEQVAEDELPQELKGKNLAEKKAYIAEKEAERAAIQKKILTLNAERQAYVEKIRKAQDNLDQAETLQDAISDSIQKQAQKLGYSFK